MTELKRLATTLERETAQYLQYQSQWRDQDLYRCPDPRYRGPSSSPVGFSVVGRVEGLESGYGFTQRHDWHRFDMAIGSSDPRRYDFLIRKEDKCCAIMTWIDAADTTLSLLIDPIFQREGRPFALFHEVDNKEEGSSLRTARLHFGDGKFFTESGQPLASDEDLWWLKYFNGRRSAICLGDMRHLTEFLRLAHQEPCHFLIEPVVGGYDGRLTPTPV